MKLSQIIYLLLLISTGLAAQESEEMIYTRSFTKLTESLRIEISKDSLEGYLLIDQKNKYVPKAQLRLIQPASGNEFLIVVDRKGVFPHIQLGSHVTNLMDNSQEHMLAFYSLDEEYLRSVLRADWAADAQFLPKEQPDIQGYARSFFREEDNTQITLILLAAELPLLHTPRELQSVHFKPGS